MNSCIKKKTYRMIQNLIKSYKNLNLYFFDQMIVSFTNFALTIIIVRSLGVEQFGVFSFFWLLLLLINSIQLAFIISPMLTNAAKKNDNNVKNYYGGVLIQQFIFTFIVFILLLIFFKFFFNIFFEFDVSKIYIVFSLTLVISQFFNFFRKFYICKKYISKLCKIDLFYGLSMILSILYFDYLNKLDIANIFTVLMFSYFVSFVIFFPSYKEIDFNTSHFINTFKENWIISKWLLLTSITQWFAANLWVVNTGIILGPYYLGIVRACQTILNVFNVLFQTIENVYPIKISEEFNKNGKISMYKYIQKINLFGFILVFLLSLILSSLSKFLLLLFFSNEISSNYYLLVFLSFLLPLTFLQYFPQHALRTISKTFPIFVAYSCSSLFAIIFSRMIILKFNMYGFIFGLFASQIIILLIIYFYYFKELAKTKL